MPASQDEDADRVTVTLYEREGCHLCEDAAVRLRAMLRPLGVPLRRVDIEDDAALQRRFMLEIPVVALNGKVVTRAPVDLEAVRRAVTRARGVESSKG